MENDSPYAAPESELVDSTNNTVKRHKKYIVFTPETELPPRCIRCNNEPVEYKKLKSSYMNPWWFLLIFLNLLVLIIVSLVVSKRFTLMMPLCEEHRNSLFTLQVFAWVTFLAGMGLFFLVIVLPENLREFSIIGGILLVLVGLIAAVKSTLGRIGKLKDGNIWFLGCKKDYLDSLPPF